MAKTHEFKIKEQISHDTMGTVYRAIDGGSGRKVALRNYTKVTADGGMLSTTEEIAYEVAIERLMKIRHASLRRILSGGISPGDRTPFMTTKWVDTEPLQSVLRETYLSVEVATTLLMQLLEVSDVLSYVLAEDGLWVETDVSSISLSGDPYNMRFVFWAAPLNLLGQQAKNRDLSALARLTESIMGWTEGHDIDESRGGHLLSWLHWLKEDACRDRTTIREVREMLAAAAGVEPPPPVDSLVAEAKRRRNWLEKIPTPSFKWIRRPKMPLFAGLSVLFVFEAIAGLWWINKINQEVENELKAINLSILDNPYDADPEILELDDEPEPVLPVDEP